MAYGVSKCGKDENMERVVLGSSGLSVSPVAFGTWQLSPRFWGDQSKEDALAAMQSAFDRGVNFFDTADAYGDGYAETVLGEALRELPREEVVVATKWFNHFNPDASRYPDLSEAYLTERCEASLKRLGVDCVDLALLHFYDELTPLEEIAQTLLKLREQGKVRAIGVSNHNTEQTRAQRCFADYSVHPAAVQPGGSRNRDGSSALLPSGEHRGDGLFSAAQRPAYREIHGRRDLHRFSLESPGFPGGSL